MELLWSIHSPSIFGHSPTALCRHHSFTFCDGSSLPSNSNTANNSSSLVNIDTLSDSDHFPCLPRRSTPLQQYPARLSLDWVVPLPKSLEILHQVDGVDSVTNSPWHGSYIPSSHNNSYNTKLTANQPWAGIASFYPTSPCWGLYLTVRPW